MEFRELLELYKNGEYKEVIRHAKGINDFNAIFLMLRSYIALYSYSDAIKTYLEYREVLEANNLLESMKVYLFLLVKDFSDKEKIDQAIEYFKDKNYVNQETEEFLCNIEEYVKKLMRDEFRDNEKTIDEIIAMLKSDDDSVVLCALDMLVQDERFKTISLLPTIEHVLKEKCKMSLGYAFLLEHLITNSYKCELLLKKDGVYYNIDPSELTKPHDEQNKLINRGFAYIRSKEKNITIGEFVTRVMIRCSYELAPNYLTTMRSFASYICACYMLASDVFKVSLDGDSVYEFYLSVADKKSIDGYRDFLKNTLK